MTDIDGLWTAEGSNSYGWPTSGILLCLHNHIFGGGERYYSVGNYRVHGQRIEIEAHVYHYHGATQSAVGSGTPDFTVHYHGHIMAGAEIIEGEVYRPEHPHLRLPVQFVRRASLPLESGR